MDGPQQSSLRFAGTACAALIIDTFQHVPSPGQDRETTTFRSAFDPSLSDLIGNVLVEATTLTDGQ